MNAIKYAFKEAAASLWRARRSGALSIVTIAAALFVLGALLLVTWNVEQLLANWSAAAEVSVYLREDVSSESRAAVDRLLAESDLVAEREYVSKADALVRFQQDFSDLASVAEDLNGNPFPASFEVRLYPSARDGARVEQLAGRLEASDGVADVRYDQRWIERVAAAVTLMRGIGLGVVSILIVAAALTVANVVRLACHARRDEIEIMQLVGAPLVYVRGPFIVEGILQGGLGAVMALGGLAASFLAARGMYGAMAAEVLGVGAVRFLPVTFSCLLVAGGMAVGCIGGLVAATSTREPEPGR